MRIKFKIIALLITSILLSTQLFSQSSDFSLVSNKSNNSSAYKAEFRFAQKNLFYFQDLEIIERIVIAVKSGKIQVFKNDELKEKITSEFFLNTIAETLSEIQHFKTKYSGESINSWIDFDENFFLQKSQTESKPGYSSVSHHLPDVFNLELRNEFVFDQFHDIKSMDIKSISLVLPSDYNSTGGGVKLGAFSYEDLMEIVFLNNKDALLPGEKLNPERMEIVGFSEMKVYSAQNFKSGE
ncbi:MAG: hypothetical protein KTR26_15710 [Flammeovirgaceae bacterium]|nr:hypothetical protein [Flammeovirgaceae bacterium]